MIYNAVDFAQARADDRPRRRCARRSACPPTRRSPASSRGSPSRRGTGICSRRWRRQPSLAERAPAGRRRRRAARHARRATSSATGLSSRVHFLGARRDLGNLLAAMDVFVMPSLWEGLPLSMVLAMGAGVPVVATRSPAFPKSSTTARPDCSCRPPTRVRSARRSNGCSSIPTLRRRAWAPPRARPSCRASASTATSTSIVGALRPAAGAGGGVKLGIVYHMPFWRAADGTLREVEGSFARYVDSLAPYFDEIVAVRAGARASRAAQGTRDSVGERDAGAAAAFRRPGAVLSAAAADDAAPAAVRARASIVLHCRVPTPAAVFAFALRAAVRPAGVLLVVGDLRALLPTMPYRGVKRLLWRALHRVRRAERAVDGRPLADVCQRRGAGGEALAAGPRGRSRRRRRRSTPATIATRDDTCSGARDADADGEPDRSAQRPARPA